jgi:lipopolysaccharide transport system ATP-binding protein
MTERVIAAEHLAKAYTVCRENQRGPRYHTLRDSLSNVARNSFNRMRGKHRRTFDTFWALDDISFEIAKGEVVGIVGRNGAGKSTLLKILSRITAPTRGRVEITGRVGSLLEVGTGFHPELTGRENIYLNGSILGMTRREIACKFDAIVAFAEMERFLDMPVKRYSSGMFVRLAFAVAAFLEPEILLIDEILAVGDAVFQRRCVERMTQLAQSGCSLLFVSHNLDLIPRFCGNAVLLDQGRLVEEDDVNVVLSHYRESLLQRTGTGDLHGCTRTGSGRAQFTSLHFLDADGNPLQAIPAGEDFRCVLDVESSYRTNDLSLAVAIRTMQGARLFTSWTEEVGFEASLTPGRHRFECLFKRIPIRPGRQLLFDIWMHDNETVDYIEDACMMDVVERTPLGVSNRADQGHALCEYAWSRT